MPRDFRPKAAKEQARKKEALDKAVRPKQVEAKLAKDVTSEEDEGEEQSDFESDEGSDASSFSDDDDDETLLREIKALGGDESDLKLITKGGQKGNKDGDDDEVDPALDAELLSFMKSLDYKGAGVQPPTLENGRKADVQSQKEQKKKASEAKEAAAKADRKSLDAGPSTVKDASEKQAQPSPFQSEFNVIPTPQWIALKLPALPERKGAKATNNDIERLHAKANAMLAADRTTYTQVINSGRAKAGGPGLLSSSDAKFINDLLAPGARGGTLSDRVAALTMLVQTSPLHNGDAMNKLLDMASKKGREESGKATRALADWLASGGGLPDRKLFYFRDHPSIPLLAQLDSGHSVDGKTREAINMHLVLIAFEDQLKRFYFDFLKTLETQSHDTVPFVRKQALTHVFVLLKEKSEQEQNLLRLLVNKLGDLDRGVASKASSHLLSLLNTHPAMKAVVTNEVSNLVMRAPSAAHIRKGKAKGLAINPHAQYYGVLTLNQTMLTREDEAVANRLVTLYFDLFEGLLKDLNINADGKEEEEQDAEGANEAGSLKRDKGRWRDKQARGKAGKPNAHSSSNVIEDADARIIAAILAGVRRALPFTKMDGAIIEKHMNTLFRITHSSTFNISIQALQLIFQVSTFGHHASANATASANDKSSSSLSSSTLQDRYYRTLYASMLDPRLARTSKQAMYLNLLFKSVKQDTDDGRTKAFVKRLVQLLDNSEPPFICGSLFLLGELFRAKPGLRGMLNDAEDDGQEHFVDVAEEGEHDTSKGTELAQNASASGYDGVKREPRFAKAEQSCLWDLVPLLSHYHPSVALCASQLITAQRINTTADLTLHTLSHFLDRFVYRNPKKRVAASKGESLMQPALHVNDSIETGVVRLRGQGIGKEEFVNSDDFWRKKVQDVPADQLFFHKFFNLRNVAADADKASSKLDDDDDQSEDGSDEDGSEDLEALEAAEKAAKVGSDSEEDSEEEREIWEAMKRTMPRDHGDDFMDESGSEGDEDDDDDLDPALMMSSDDDEDEGDDDDDDDDDDDMSDNAFDEDEDDLLPFEFPSEDEEAGKKSTSIGSKRKAGDGDAEETTAGQEGLSKSQLRRAQRKKQKSMPTFATADDYAHLLGDSDEEEG